MNEARPQKRGAALEPPLEQPCPIRDVLDRIGDQWSLLVLEALDGRTRRFNELLRAIGDISKQMLSTTLKRLEQDGFVTRTLFGEIPPRVEYALTELGRSFLVPLRTLITWADSHHRLIVASRQRYGARNGNPVPSCRVLERDMGVFGNNTIK